jgi:hypothetical protein
MHHVDSFLDTYVRIDEGTVVVLCIQRSCLRTGMWLYTAVTMRGPMPSMVCFDQEDDSSTIELDEAVASALSKPSARRVVVIVCESAGPSFGDVLEGAAAPTLKKVQIYRVSGDDSTKAGDVVANAVGVG